MAEIKFPRLHFDYPFDERTAFEAEARGYWSHSRVELEDGSFHPVVFYHPIRLQQDLEEESAHGRPFIAEKGMIVVENVDVESMERAVIALEREGFFK